MLKESLAREHDKAVARYDPRLADQFCGKSLSDHTRRAYQRIVREFFRFVNWKPYSEVTPDDVRRWRDSRVGEGKRPSTVALDLTVIRSLYAYLQAAGHVSRNPASTKLVSVPEVPEHLAGRALIDKEVRYLLAGPDRTTARGARDYALMMVMLRLSLRVSEACSLRASSINWTAGRWTLVLKVKGGRERVIPLPKEVKAAIDAYLELDRQSRTLLSTGGPDSPLFQPLDNRKSLRSLKPLSTRAAWDIIQRWAEYGRLGRVSPHDLRRTFVTHALDQGISYRQIQMATGHRDPKTVQRYDHGRENLELNAINFVAFDKG